MPWLDTGIESRISRQQIHPGRIQESDLQTLQTCPGRIQESSLELVVNRYTLARYRNQIFKLFRRALAGYRYRVYNKLLTDVPWLDTGIESRNSRQQIHPDKIQESDLQTLQTWSGRIQESSLEFLHADMPWLDAGIESSNSSGVPWLDTGIESGASKGEDRKSVV